MEIRIERGCPKCGKKLPKFSQKSLASGIDRPKSSTFCCGQEWDFGDLTRRFQCDKKTASIISSVITKEEDQDKLRKNPKETIEYFQNFFSSLRKGKIEINKNTKPVTLKWVPFNETPGT